jgi:hypothetical protein
LQPAVYPRFGAVTRTHSRLGLEVGRAQTQGGRPTGIHACSRTPLRELAMGSAVATGQPEAPLFTAGGRTSVCLTPHSAAATFPPRSGSKW